MTTRFRRRRRFATRRKRATAWRMDEYRPGILTPGGRNHLDLTTDAAVETSAGGAAMPRGMAREGLTLTRELITGHIFIPDPGTVDDATLWFGLIIVSAQAFALNAFPAPGLDDGDWIYLGCRDVRHRSAVVSGFDPASFARLDYDSRTMRRLRAGEDRLVFAVRNDNGSLGNVDSEWCIRTLWLLP